MRRLEPPQQDPYRNALCGSARRSSRRRMGLGWETAYYMGCKNTGSRDPRHAWVPACPRAAVALSSEITLRFGTLSRVEERSSTATK